MDERHVTFKCGDIELEGCASIEPDRPSLIVCHPHPLYGGSMDSSVVLALRNAARNLGMATLRFNFRGTGKSGGRHSDGVHEIEDAKAALEFLLQQNVDAHNISIAGYSFGARIALKLASQDGRIKKVVAVAAPSSYDYSFLKHCATPKLIILGEYDDIAPPKELERILANMPNVEITVIKGADHQFHGELEHIRDIAQKFLSPKTIYKDYCGR